MMRTSWLCAAAAAALLLVAGACAAQPRVLRIASANDPQTMDPHAVALLYQSRVVQQIYEGLVDRDEKFRLQPSLALSWSAVDAKTWRFKLRPGVKFHDGSAFTADDAVFSIERALKPSSQRALQMHGITGVRKIDPLTIDILLDSPDALLPERLFLVDMMSRAWCEQHQVVLPQDYNGKQETFAVRNAMGTGPFMLKRYESDVRTTLAAFPSWWGRATHPGNLDEAQFLVIQSDATRLAALNSGQVDVVLDPPFQDVARLRAAGGLKILETGDIGTQYLALDQHSAELPGNPGRPNPLKDVRVRRAIYQALDMPLIVRQVLRGQAQATGSPLSAQMDGYLPEFETRPPYDPAAARALLKEAGYPNGFSLPFDCLNTGFRQAVCQAMAAMLERVGIRATLQVAPSALFFPKLTQATISMAEFGWSPTPDPWIVLQSLVHTTDGRNSGVFNAGRYSDAKLDALIDAIRVEPDLARRREKVAEAVRLMGRELPVLPLYRVQQIWVARPGVELVQWPNSVLALRWARLAVK
ncbi:ABC transporter substrate-binding protein [Paucibacter sp. R3-3]|uniref:ABC transporter substrate-binding protein n=1 Tax=Roseateles agri TaxID=3098619 RepID=A0ABU5DTA4_9BURK|nr:ABC transporter substrate-binding protein [Paucibacter sp. R3-3]MDY0749116.1 ABC transporter substrate-binding protein [Paucibacter sp. R3-3]